jgi:predicted ribosome quality control (RQC) complex YloA/Tae2 family protein
MEYRYLAAWTQDAAPPAGEFKAIEQFEEYYRISLKKSRHNLIIVLASKECYCFWDDQKRPIPFTASRHLNLMQDALRGTRLDAVSILPGERIITLQFTKTDIYNQHITQSLILELIPRYQNIILTRHYQQGLQIIDAVRKVSFAENRHRQILPGTLYQPPVSDYINDTTPLQFPLSVSPAGIHDAAEKGTESTNQAMQQLFDLLLAQREARIKKQAGKKLEKQIEKLQRKLAKQQQELQATDAQQQYQQWAELLKSQQHRITSGMESIEVTDYFSPDMPSIVIPLQAHLPAHENVNYYFKKYRKARDGKLRIAQQIELTETAIEELYRALFDVDDMDVFAAATLQKKAESRKNRSYKAVQWDGQWQICVGRTSRENDELTTRYAKPRDLWFHTRVFRGTHVILRNFAKQDVPDWLISLCCRIAAYYSKAKKSSNVPVDFTEIRYVRKPRGSVAGYVTYTNQKTLYVDPLSFRDAVQMLQQQGATLQE